MQDCRAVPERGRFDQALDCAPDRYAVDRYPPAPGRDRRNGFAQLPRVPAVASAPFGKRGSQQGVNRRGFRLVAIASEPIRQVHSTSNDSSGRDSDPRGRCPTATHLPDLQRNELPQECFRAPGMQTYAASAATSAGRSGCGNATPDVPAWGTRGTANAASSGRVLSAVCVPVPFPDPDTCPCAADVNAPARIAAPASSARAVGRRESV